MEAGELIVMLGMLGMLGILGKEKRRDIMNKILAMRCAYIDVRCLKGGFLVHCLVFCCLVGSDS